MPLLTIPMLAVLLELPVATVRRWYKRGWIVPVQKVHNLAYFDFQEALTVKALRDLRREGMSAQRLEDQLHQIQGMFPDIERPLAQLAAIVEGKKEKDVLLRKGNQLVDYKGQGRFDFTNLEFPPDTQTGEPLQCLDFVMAPSGPSAETLYEAALLLESEGDLQGALNTCRAALFAGGPDAEINFQIAEILYRSGDLSAARERYYMALEIDEKYVEARANLGCLLAESGEWELAVSAFQGTLADHPDYAEVHYQLGAVLWENNRRDEARRHFETFLQLQPDSPLAEKVKEMRNEK